MEDDEARQLDGHELARRYLAGEVVGSVVMERVLAVLGMSDYAEQTLTRQDGSALRGPDGSELRAVDYMAIAKQHNADGILLGFIAGSPNEQQISTLRGMIRNYLGNAK